MSDNRSNKFLANNLGYLLVQKNMSPKKLADGIDVSYSTVKNWLDAKNYPQTVALDKLVNFLDCSYRDLTGDNHHELMSIPLGSGPTVTSLPKIKSEKTSDNEIGDNKLESNNDIKDDKLMDKLIKLICQLDYADKQKALKTLKVIFSD